MKKPTNKRIVLIGFRGCGKSTIAKQLAEMLEWNYVSTDRLIEEKKGMSISRIVEENGWNYFRKLESEVINELQASKRSVIDTGGGVAIEHGREIDKLLDSSIVIWIDASLADIVQRLRNDANRPLLNQGNFIEDIEFNYKKRQPHYQNLAAYRFNTSVESAEEICNKIISEMRSA